MKTTALPLAIISVLFIWNCNPAQSQTQKANSQVFWENLETLCGKSYAAEVVAAPEGDSFRGQELIMHVRSCEDNRIRIPFFVGENKSRTWDLTLDENNHIQLKHDHRYEDGSEEEVTQYGGKSPNVGLQNIQLFPADEETVSVIEAAATNVWWIELKADEYFTYNLRRLGTDRYFSIKFDLTKEVETPDAPWGWMD